MQINWVRGQHFHDNTPGGKRLQPLLDDCPVCNSSTALAYKSLWVAACPSGHTFDRCKLTLLPIMDPSRRKTCSDCMLEFIDEYKHPEMKVRTTTDQDKLINKDAANSNSVVVRSSTGEIEWLNLANHVFDEFDRCPYCQGYFTG